MKNKSFIIYSGLALMLIFSSCSDPINPAVVEYYITADESSNYETLDITFDYARAYQEGDETGTTAITTVNLDRQELILATDGTQEPVFLGSSEIEPRKIFGYNFSFSFISVIKQGAKIEVQQKNYDESNKVESEFSLSPGETKKIIFVINTDESISVLANNELKFLAKIAY